MVAPAGKHCTAGGSATVPGHGGVSCSEGRLVISEPSAISCSIRILTAKKDSIGTKREFRRVYENRRSYKQDFLSRGILRFYTLDLELKRGLGNIFWTCNLPQMCFIVNVNKYIKIYKI